MATGQFMSVALSVALAASLAGSASAKEPAKPRVVSWLLPMCPTVMTDADLKGLQSNLDARESRSAFLSMLLVKGIDVIFDSVGAALSAAAEKNLKGVATAGVSPSYLYDYWKSDAATVLPRSCVAVAFTASAPSSWCSAAAFKGTLVCGTLTDSRGNAVSLFDRFAPQGVAPLTGTGLPLLYAEIQLVPSHDRTAFLPRTVAFYYRTSVHKEFAKPKTRRDVIISAGVTTPKGDAAMGSLVARIADAGYSDSMRTRFPAGGTTTSNADVVDSFDQATIAAWVPVTAVPEKWKSPETSGPVIPVNIKSEIREIGDPNPLLQFVAKWFAANQDKLADSVKSRVVPEMREAAEAAAESAAAAEKRAATEATAAAYVALRDFVKACKPDANVPELARRADAIRTGLTAQLAVAKALALQPAGDPPPVFTPDVKGLSTTGDTAEAICRSGGVVP